MVRRPAARVALTAALLLLLGSGGRDPAPDSPSVSESVFVTLPDRIPPEVDVTAHNGAAGRRAQTDDALFFLAPKDGDAMTGPLIVDSSGEPVWIGPDLRAYDLRVRRYRGRPVLTFWHSVNAPRAGEVVIMDRSYQRIATVTTRGVAADAHEAILTPRGTALLIGYRTVRRDLSRFGGPKNGWVRDNVVQEGDVETGRLLFEWSAIEHIPLADGRIRKDPYGIGTKAEPWDYIHINSVAEDGDALLVSARNTCAVYRIDRRTGKVDWILGGRSGDFRFADGARFFWQHDARRHPDGTITLFDNHGTYDRGGQSRGLRLRVNEKTHRVRVVHAYRLPDGRLAATQGNMFVRPNRHVVIGWGSSPQFSEFAADGRLLLDADFGTGESYRVYRMPWVGRPAAPPDLVVMDGTAYVGWNGATEVTAWRFLAGESADDASVVATVPREGFETSLEVPDEPYVAAEALDAEKNVLGTAVSDRWPLIARSGPRR